jgi:glucokinase
VEGAGIGCAGLIDGAGVVRHSPNLPAWEGKRLGRIAGRLLGVHTNVENDATAAAWGEYRCGGNDGCNDFVFITLGTGVGGGVVSGGRLVRGAGNFGGEVGHVCVHKGGRRCHCGARGCAEAYVGSYGMVRTAREMLARRRGRLLSRWVEDEGRRLTPGLVADAARRGDALARAVIADAAEHLGVLVASLVHVLNPEVVVLGGGISASFDLFLPHVRRTLKRQVFSASAGVVRIERSLLGNDATAIGAALLARDAGRASR